jgi:starch synthase
LQANTRIEDHLTRVVIPCYDTKFKKENKFECVHWGFVKLGKFDFSFNVKETTDKLGFGYLIEILNIRQKNVYGYKDDIERFVSFQIATLDWIIGREMPDVINCHDHHRFDSIYDVVLR